jgi:hypothetical protein
MATRILMALLGLTLVLAVACGTTATPTAAPTAPMAPTTTPATMSPTGTTIPTAAPQATVPQVGDGMAGPEHALSFAEYWKPPTELLRTASVWRYPAH